MNIDSIIVALDCIDTERDLLEHVRHAKQQAEQRASGQGRGKGPGAKVILNRVAKGSHT